MKNIHILPTTPNDETAKGIWIKETRDWCNIYITNDEEIKEGDLIIYKNGDEYYFAEYRLGYYDRYELCKKIILTTDQDLIADGVQKIPDEFLDWFVKNSSCEFVEVEHIKVDDARPSGYKITIPKEEHIRDVNWKSQIIDKVLDEDDETKQETLEEAAERYVDTIPNLIYTSREGAIISFIAGAKWQQQPEQFFNDDRVKTLEKSLEYLLKKQERMYSDEDMTKYALYILNNSVITPKEWFNQFKKK